LIAQGTAVKRRSSPDLFGKRSWDYKPVNFPSLLNSTMYHQQIQE